MCLVESRFRGIWKWRAKAPNEVARLRRMCRKETSMSVSTEELVREWTRHCGGGKRGSPWGRWVTSSTLTVFSVYSFCCLSRVCIRWQRNLGILVESGPGRDLCEQLHCVDDSVPLPQTGEWNSPCRPWEWGDITEETEEKVEKTTGCRGAPQIYVGWVYPTGKRKRGRQLADDRSFVDLLA